MQTHLDNNLSHQNKTSAYDDLELHFEMKPKNQNNMELESHSSFCVLIFVAHLTFIFVYIIKYLIVELGGH
jgi:hypothetical protein